MIPRLYYGWFDRRDHVFRVSRYPADSPVRPSLAFDTKAEAETFAKDKKATMTWWPPLHPEDGR